VLLIDDIQFLQGKVQTQEEFFHTFNTLHNANKQVVITSDVPPKLLSGFEERMRSRFEMGLLTDVIPPDLETRIAILRKKAIQEQLSVSDDVLEFIASRISTNIRELEGALIRVTAFANLNRQPVDMSLAEIVLKDLIPDDASKQITAATIMAQTAAYFGLTLDDLKGASRSRVLVTARQIAMYLCRELTDDPLTKIGKNFGGLSLHDALPICGPSTPRSPNSPTGSSRKPADPGPRPDTRAQLVVHLRRSRIGDITDLIHVLCTFLWITRVTFRAQGACTAERNVVHSLSVDNCGQLP